MPVSEDSKKTGNSSTTLFDLHSEGVFLIKDLTPFLAISDSEWIHYYNLGLRKVYLNEFIDKNLLSHLTNKIEALNYLAKEISLPLVTHKSITENKFNQLYQEAYENKINATRRMFFKRMTPNLTSSQELHHQHLPHLVIFNSNTCTACDDCVKICPSKALVIVKIAKETTEESNPESNTKSELQLSYHLQPNLCDGCALCESVCASRSIHTVPYQSNLNSKLSIVQLTCTQCQKNFHQNPQNPAAFQTNSLLCPICAESQRLHANYQVFKNLKGDLRIVEK